MPRKKIAAPEPNEQELMEQAVDAMEGAAAEETDHDGTPSEETLAQMEREYLASSADGAVPPEDGSDAPIDDNVGDGDNPPSNEDMSGSGEPTYEEQAASEPDGSTPEEKPQGALPVNADAGGGEPPAGSPVGEENEVSGDYAALLKELGEAGAEDTGETPLLSDSEAPGEAGVADAPSAFSDGGSDPDGSDLPGESMERQSEPERRTPGGEPA